MVQWIFNQKTEKNIATITMRKHKKTRNKKSTKQKTAASGETDNGCDKTAYIFRWWLLDEKHGSLINYRMQLWEEK